MHTELSFGWVWSC